MSANLLKVKERNNNNNQNENMNIDNNYNRNQIKKRNYPYAVDSMGKIMDLGNNQVVRVS